MSDSDEGFLLARYFDFGSDTGSDSDSSYPSYRKTLYYLTPYKKLKIDLIRAYHSDGWYQTSRSEITHTYLFDNLDNTADDWIALKCAKFNDEFEGLLFEIRSNGLMIDYKVKGQRIYSINEHRISVRDDDPNPPSEYEILKLLIALEE